MSGGKLRVGIIGGGRISDLHAAGYLANPGAEIVAVCDADRSVAERRRAQWGARAAYADYRDLLQDPGVDAVDIITPQRFHEEMAVAALDRGKHVSVQKPMSVSLASADRMVAAAAASGRVFRLFENYVFYPPLELARKLIDDGAIGDPTSMRIKFVSGARGGWDVPDSAWTWRKDEHRKGFGMQTFDHGHHMWSVAWYLMGEVEKVHAWIDSVDGSIDCPAVISWKYSGGPRYGTCDYAHGTDLEIPSDYYACDEWFEVTGSRGIVMVNRCTGKLSDAAPVRVFSGGTWKDHRGVDTDWASGFKRAVDNFVDAAAGRAAPSLSAERGRSVLAMDLAIQESARSGRAVDLEGFSDGP